MLDLLTVYVINIIVVLIPPKIDTAFGTRTAIVAQEACNGGGDTCSESDADGMCNFYINKPEVTLIIQ